MNLNETSEACLNLNETEQIWMNLNETNKNPEKIDQNCVAFQPLCKPFSYSWSKPQAIIHSTASNLITKIHMFFPNHNRPHLKIMISKESNANFYLRDESIDNISNRLI